MSDDLSTPSVVDLDAIFQPISEESPAGDSLRYSGLYDEINEARRADDALAQGDWQTQLKTADFNKVEKLSVNALTTLSKDLQVAAWLSQALIKLYGFAGLRDSLKMMSGLQDRYWETLFPVVDEGDMEGRANAVAWLDTQGALDIKYCPYTAGRGYGYNDWADAKRFDFPDNLESLDYESQQRFTQLRTQAEKEGRTTADMWKSAIAQTPRAFCEETNRTVEECWAALGELNAVIESKYDRNQMPALSALNKALEEVHERVKKLLDKKRLEEPDPADTEEETESTGEEGATGEAKASSGKGPISGRPEALKRLAEIAAYFQKTEPHSPVSYLVQRAVKWGNMPLDNWLQDVIKDESVLGQLRETLGIVAGFADDGYSAGSGSDTGEQQQESSSNSDW